MESDSIWTLASNWIAFILVGVMSWLITDVLRLKSRVTTLEAMRTDAKTMHDQESKHRDKQHDAVMDRLKDNQDSTNSRMDDMSERIHSIEVYLRDAG